MNTKKLVNFGTSGFASPGAWTVAQIDHTTLDVTIVDAPLKRRQLRLPRYHIGANALRVRKSTQMRDELAPAHMCRLQRQPQFPFTAP